MIVEKEHDNETPGATADLLSSALPAETLWHLSSKKHLTEYNSDLLPFSLLPTTSWRL